MSIINLGIIGGGQLGSMLAVAAKKLNIKTTIYCDDINAPAQNFCDEFICGKYDDKNKILDFVSKTTVITFEFENIPYQTLNEINKHKPVLPKPSVNRLIQHRLAEKDFINKLNIRTTRYVSIEKKSEIETLEDFLRYLFLIDYSVETQVKYWEDTIGIIDDTIMDIEEIIL